MKQFLVTTLVVLAAATVAVGQCSDADKKKLEAFDKAWGEASERGDRAALEKIYADNFLGTSPAGTTTKKEAVDNAVRQAERNRANPPAGPSFSPDLYMITCTPNSAVITHRNRFMARVDGKEELLTSRSVHVLERRGDTWQVVGNAGHPVDDGGVLLYMERDWDEAIKRGDASWIEENYAPDASDISSVSGRRSGKAEALESAKNDKSVVEWTELSDLSVRVEGNAGIVTGVYHIKGRDERGQPFERKISYTDTYIKRDGRWWVWASQGTEVR